MHEAVYSDDDPDILNDLQWDKDTHRNPVDISMDLVRGMLDLYMKHEVIYTVVDGDIYVDRVNGLPFGRQTNFSWSNRPRQN